MKGLKNMSSLKLLLVGGLSVILMAQFGPIGLIALGFGLLLLND